MLVEMKMSIYSLVFVQQNCSVIIHEVGGIILIQLVISDVKL